MTVQTNIKVGIWLRTNPRGQNGNCYDQIVLEHVAIWQLRICIMHDDLLLRLTCTLLS